MAVCTTIEWFIAWGYLVWLTNILCCHGNGCGGFKMCAKFHCLMYSYGVECVIITCGQIQPKRGLLTLGTHALKVVCVCVCVC